MAGGIVPAAAARPAIRHDLTIRLDPVSHQLDGADLITFDNYAPGTIEISLAEHLNIKKLESYGRPIPYTFSRGVLRVMPTFEREVRRLRLIYSGLFDDPAPFQPINVDNPGFGVTGTIHAQGVLLLSGAQWYPRTGHNNEIYHLTVDAPAGMVAVTSGKNLGHTIVDGRSLSRWSVHPLLRGVSLAAGQYQVETKTFGDVTIATYFSEALQDLAPGYLNASGRYIQFYENLFGPYPFDQFAVVENFFPTGYGFPAFTLMGRRVLRLPFIIHTSLGHEIAHCWWGNGVLVDPSQGNWSEGLTTYVADYLYKEQSDEKRAYDYRRQWLRNYSSLVNPAQDFPLSEFTSRKNPVTKAIGYDKAAMVFHMLRRTVGEDHFWGALRDIYRRHRFETISWRHFQNAFEHRAGRSLERFFRQWVFRQGAPVLSLSDIAVTQTDTGLVVSGQINQVRPFYALHLDLALQTDEKTWFQSLTISDQHTYFSISAKGRPKQLTVDPQTHIFRRLAPEELPPTINSVKGSASALVVVAQHLDDSWMAVAQRLAAAMGLSKARIDRLNSFSRGELADADLILVGLPEDRNIIPLNKDQFNLDQHRFTVEGQTFTQSNASFFGVFSQPQNNGRVVALFMPASQILGKVLSTKIPHYGKYSYLLFNGPRNQIKGTWPVDVSPLMVRWP